MKIAFIGKFQKLYDEEYIARSLESLGHEVYRIPDHWTTKYTLESLEGFGAELLLFSKLKIPEPLTVLDWTKRKGIKTVSWIFDLYWGYDREPLIYRQAHFKADVVFSTDGGHETEWKKAGVNHFCVRQGIYKPECYMEKGNPEGVVFVGWNNPLWPYRAKVINHVRDKFGIVWHGRTSTHEVRGTGLNTLYAGSKVVFGDSVYSPYYWSNRVVETLGRGGFLIHSNVPGIKEEYPFLVTYEYGDLADLDAKIDFYLNNDLERERLREKNFNWVKDYYTCDRKCAELLSKI